MIKGKSAYDYPINVNFRLLKRIKYNSTMSLLSSPFMDSIRECKLTMRKLRKKIYKHSISARPAPKRLRDTTDQIIEIFRERQVPEFVTDSLRRRRSFDLTSIKNIAVLTQLPLQEIQHRTNLQEREANQLYESHKQRMHELRSRTQQLRAERQAANPSHPTAISSTTEESLLFSSVEQQQSEPQLSRESYQNFSQQSREQGPCENYFELHSPESSLNSELALFTF